MPKNQTEKESFPEIPFLYDLDEYKNWTSENDIIRNKQIESLLDISGNLCNNRSIYVNQAKKGKGSQHYPEVKFATHLIVDEGFNKECIIYQKYTLSLKEASRLYNEIDLSKINKSNLMGYTKMSEDLMRAVGTSRLREVFSDEFFKEFAKIYYKNKDKNIKDINTINVDICAINNSSSSKICFAEIKKYKLKKYKNKNTKRHEGVSDNQLYFLGFVRHIVDKLKEEAFRKREIIPVETRIVVFVLRDDQKCLEFVINKAPHDVTFYV
jgi:hypothetical protein